jgi:hypothetical protein
MFQRTISLNEIAGFVERGALLPQVKFQPEGQESGWLPIETGHVGNGFGILAGKRL